MGWNWDAACAAYIGGGILPRLHAQLICIVFRHLCCNIVPQNLQNHRYRWLSGVFRFRPGL